MIQKAATMCCGRDFKPFLLWLMYFTSLSLFTGVYGVHKFSETESFINFIRTVDPQNLIGAWWNASMVDCCSEQRMGVICDSQKHTIMEIRLENLNLSGVIDAESLCKLSSLQVLSLAKNLIKGHVPDAISNCTSLTHLNLSGNLLHGRVPASLTNLKSLRSLDISNNNFSGTFPKFKQKFKYIHQYIAVSSTSKIASSDTPSPAEPPRRQSANDGIEWLPLVLGMAFISLFVFFVNKKKSDRGKKDIQSLEDSSIKIPAVKAVEEMKPEEEFSELVFFVKEHERFKIEDLLQSAADLQAQSLNSSLYKVRLKNNIILAVKRLKKLQVSLEEFGRTMSHVGNLKHPNILPLVAYHSSNEEKLLIYRYQRNGSLLTLFENYMDGKRNFPWRLRLSIASGIARGLEFIYRRSGESESIPHGNIKLSNILLAENEEPLITEYGFQRFVDPKRAALYSSNGYKAPEKKLTEQADVYSFGIILLELLTGKTVEKSGLDLPKWVKSMVREEWTGEVFDKEVNKVGKQWAFPLLNVSLKCVSHSPDNRPSIVEVLEKIEEVVNDQEDFSFSSTSSVESNQHDSCLIHTVIPETQETPGLNH